MQIAYSPTCILRIVCYTEHHEAARSVPPITRTFAGCLYSPMGEGAVFLLMPTVDHIAQLKPDPRNARRHNPRNVGMIASALNEVGAARSIVIDEDNVVLAGNATIEAAAQAGITRVVEVEADGNTIIAVRRRGLDKKQKKRLALYDNRAAELAEWEPAVLYEERDILDGLFTGQELDDILRGLTEEPQADPGAQIDRAAELQEKWGTERGQLWQIGRHRLLCGDSTSADDVARLMGTEKARAVIADPPYGMNLDTDYSDIAKSWSKQALAKGKGLKMPSFTQSRKYDPVIGDSQDFDPTGLLAAFSDCPEIFLWGGDYYANKLPKGGGWFVWDKTGYHTQQVVGSEFELCWSKQAHKRRILSFKWSGVMGLQSQDVKHRVHPTQKPLEVVRELLSFTKEGDVVVDPYVGSGTTMVAAEQTGRTCYGCEIEPKYVAVTLERLKGMGLEPRLVSE